MLTSYLHFLLVPSKYNKASKDMMIETIRIQAGYIYRGFPFRILGKGRLTFSWKSIPSFIEMGTTVQNSGTLVWVGGRAEGC